jgi:hypothetical protein
MTFALAVFLAVTTPPPTQTTRFHLINEKGVDWIVRPDGRKLWSFGVCCVDQGVKQKDYKADNPSYAAFRYYPGAATWASDTLGRLTKWGFNTVGAWSDDVDLQMVSNQPDVVFIPILHIGSSAGAPWKDMWDPATVKLMDEVGKTGIEAHHRDPRVMGYFSDNEQGWWFGAMWDWAFKAGPASRGHVVDLLQRRYHDWKALNVDFDPDGAGSFDALRKRGRLFLRPGRNGIHTVQAWMSIVSDRYYSICRSIIKKYDPGALYLGDRYISNFYPEVARSAGKYCDIVSTNLNAVDNAGDFAPFYLPALRALTGRPIMITEYYEAARENRSGNKNDSSGFPVVNTQAERANAFAKQTGTFAHTPYVVGAHWFQYYDEPKKGREDGENYDMGLVDVDNRAYEAMAGAASQSDVAYQHGASTKWVATDRKPATSATRELWGIGDLSRLSDWIENGKRQLALDRLDRGDLYVGHEEGELLLGVYWEEDRFAGAFYRSGKVPAEDRAHLTLEFGGQNVSMGIGDELPSTSNSTMALELLTGVRNFTVVRVPLEIGNSIAVHLQTRARAYQMSWSFFVGTPK